MADTEKGKKKGAATGLDSQGNRATAEHARLYELYCLWLSLPPVLLSYKYRNKLMKPEDVADKFGIADETLRELLSVRYQKDFAAKYGVAENTLTDWKRRIGVSDVLAESRKWATQLTHNVVMKMYENALKNGGMSFKDREMFFKVVNQWNEKLALEHHAGESLADLIKQTLRKNVSKPDDKR